MTLEKRFCFVFTVLFLCVYPWFNASGSEGGIKDTESAKHGTDAAQYSIVDNYKFTDFKVIQFDLPVLSVYSYLLISNGEALMIDPVRDISFYLDTAEKENVKIKGVYVSHSHADFVAGHMEVVKAIGCPVYQSKKSGANYNFKPLEDGSTLSIGKALIRFIDTPGHTPDGMCAIVSPASNPDKPEIVLTGDVMFVGSVGRPDLMGGTVSAGWLASAMFDSWSKKISLLSDEVRVFPAHGAGSLCGAHLSDEPYSTIGKERATNSYLKHTTRGAFVAALMDGLPEAPQYFKHNAAMNKKGPELVNWNAPMPEEIKPSNSLSSPDKYYIVDIRDAAEYASGHIRNSVNIGLRGRLETWVGIMVPWNAKVVLTGSPEELKEALYRLNRIGYRADIISIGSWKKAGLPMVNAQLIKPAGLYKKMNDGTAPVIVDVRLPSEWMALKIGTVLNMPLSQLEKLSVQLDPDEPVVAVCNSAYRSSMAVGVLEKKGFKNAMSLDGGSQAWINASYPVIEASQSGQTVSAPGRYIKLPERISPEELKRMLMDLPGTFDLVDIRPQEHFSDFNIPGSRNVDIADIIANPSYLVGPSPIIIVDRDGSLAMAVGGILSQKSNRPVKVLFGGLDAYWSGGSGAQRSAVPLTPSVSGGKGVPAPAPSAVTPPAQNAPATGAKKKSAGC